MKYNTLSSLQTMPACLLLSLLCASTAQAELTLNAMAGVADHTTAVRGDALYNFNAINTAGYYKYPQDIATTDFAGGLSIRYLYAFTPCFDLGLETGYVYVNVNKTRLRADNLLPNSTDVEDFTTKSNGLILLNAVARIPVAPQTTLAIFGGPAWLNTKYTANAYGQNTVRHLGSSYQLTADAGVEVGWAFNDCWSAGLRYDYIFFTDSRTVADTGAGNLALLADNTAKSRLSMITANIKYVIPGF